MKLKTDKLLVSAYVRHGDMCGLNSIGVTGEERHDRLGCASGHKASDYVLVAKFAYLQEGIDYCHEGARRGCRMLLVSRIARPAMHWHYIPEGMGMGGLEPMPDYVGIRVVKRQNTEVRS